MELIAELTPVHRQHDQTIWRPRVIGAATASGSWTAWLQFSPVHGGDSVLTSPVETTQPDREAVAYWSTGLEEVYLQGALDRAMANEHDRDATQSAAPVRPVHLQQIDLYVLDFVRRAGPCRVETKSLFDDHVYPNADLVRSFEHLEQNHRLLVRSTENGRDWLQLTECGAASLDTATRTADSPAAEPAQLHA